MTQQEFRKVWVDPNGDLWDEVPNERDSQYWGPLAEHLVVPVGSYVVTPDEMPEVESDGDHYRVGGYFYHERDAVHARSGVLRFTALLTFLAQREQEQDPDAEVLKAFGEIDEANGPGVYLTRLREAGFDIVKKEN